ncbi:MAG: hypothetical protein DI555_06895 [Novosphingobium pentaromativorans]|uniref:Uncharacterized protein n=1 Tax=Novosphingobium pentaromativorans TaxID=205844 RepID=A0A2W5QDU1_9SPHN|nr:MAG: hypothetical protein DI555_06895 [Novosphingobium pentaromativorans]
MKAGSIEMLRAGMTAAPVSMDRLEASVLGAEKRLRRAREKADAAEAELDAAVQWLERMKAEREDFVNRQGMLL